MGACPMLLEFGGGAGGDLADGQAGSVGGDDRAGRRCAATRSRSLRLISRFSATTSTIQSASAHQSRLSSKLPTVMRAADGGSKEGRGARLERGVEAGADDAIADAGVGKPEAVGLFLGREFGRDDVQQPAGDAGVGQVRGDRAPMVRHRGRRPSRCVVSCGAAASLVRLRGG